MTQRIDGTRGRHPFRSMHRQLAIMHHMGHMKTYQHRGSFGAFFVADHSSDSQFGTRPSGGRHHDDRQGISRHRQEFQQQGLDGHMGHFYPCRHHLTAIHHRTSAQGDDGFRLGFQSLLPTGLNNRNRRLRVDIGKYRIADIGSLQRGCDGALKT